MSHESKSIKFSFILRNVLCNLYYFIIAEFFDRNKVTYLLGNEWLFQFICFWSSSFQLNGIKNQHSINGAFQFVGPSFVAPIFWLFTTVGPFCCSNLLVPHFSFTAVCFNLLVLHLQLI